MPDDAGTDMRRLFLNQTLNLQNLQHLQEGLPVITKGLLPLSSAPSHLA